MSLDRAQRRQTAQEFHDNLRLSGRNAADLATELRWSADRMTRTLDLSPGADPVDVWELRDVLQRAVRTAGGEPVPYSVLTEQSRAAARAWFPLRGDSRR